MANDTRISLPKSLGTFIIEGEPENGRPVWFRVTVWDLEYKVSNDSTSILCQWEVTKQTSRFSNPPGWFPEFLRNSKRMLWWVDSGRYGSNCIVGQCSDLRYELRNKALNKGIIIGPALMQAICGPAEIKGGDLIREIAEAYRSSPHSLRVA